MITEVFEIMYIYIYARKLALCTGWIPIETAVQDDIDTSVLEGVKDYK